MDYDKVCDHQGIQKEIRKALKFRSDDIYSPLWTDYKGESTQAGIIVSELCNLSNAS